MNDNSREMKRNFHFLNSTFRNECNTNTYIQGHTNAHARIHTQYTLDFFWRKDGRTTIYVRTLIT